MPYLGYRTDNFFAKLGYSISGGRKNSPFSLFAGLYYSRQNWSIGYEFDGNKVVTDDFQTISDTDNFKKEHGIFFHWENDRDWLTDMSLINSKSYYSNTNFESNELYLEFAKSLYKKNYFLVLKTDFVKKNGPALSTANFITDKATSYYLGGMYKKTFSLWNYQFKAFAGADNGRGLDFGKLWFLEQLVQYNFGEDKFLRTNLMYTNEVFTDEKSDSWQIGLSIGFWY